MFDPQAVIQACAQHPTEVIEAEIEKLRAFCRQQREYHADPAAMVYRTPVLFAPAFIPPSNC